MPPKHGRMHNLLQHHQGSGSLKTMSPKAARSIRPSARRTCGPKACDDFLLHSRVMIEHLVNNLIGIDSQCASLGRQAHNGRLSGGDIAGQANNNLTRRCGLFVQDSSSKNATHQRRYSCAASQLAINSRQLLHQSRHSARSSGGCCPHLAAGVASCSASTISASCMLFFVDFIFQRLQSFGHADAVHSCSALVFRPDPPSVDGCLCGFSSLAICASWSRSSR